MSHTTRKRRRKRRPQWFCAFKKRENTRGGMRESEIYVKKALPKEEGRSSSWVSQ
jgi:hypothetical protein